MANTDRLENPPFLALSDRTRYRIFLRLFDVLAPVKVIAADLPISQLAVFQHLKALEAGGLIMERREGHIFSENATAVEGPAMADWAKIWPGSDWTYPWTADQKVC